MSAVFDSIAVAPLATVESSTVESGGRILIPATAIPLGATRIRFLVDTSMLRDDFEDGIGNKICEVSLDGGVTWPTLRRGGGYARGVWIDKSVKPNIVYSLRHTGSFGGSGRVFEEARATLEANKEPVTDEAAKALMPFDPDSSWCEFFVPQPENPNRMVRCWAELAKEVATTLKVEFR